jgi:hypothetical protein
VNETIQVDQGSRRDLDLDAGELAARPPAGARLGRNEADDLEWFFGVAPSLFWHSTGVPSDLMSPHEIMRAGFEYRRVRADNITAYPTAEYRNVKGVEPDRVTMRRFGRISSSTLSLIAGPDGNAVDANGQPDLEARCASRLQGEALFLVLKTYFGNEGNVWDQLAVVGGAFEVARKEGPKNADGDEIAPGPVIYEEPKPGERARFKGRVPLIREKHSVEAGHRAHGRIGSLYALTRGGKLLLEYSARIAKKKGQPWYDFSDQQRLQLELRGATKLNGDQKALLARAQREARLLFVSACFAWNRVRAGERDE